MDLCFSHGAAIPSSTSIPVTTNPRLAELRDPSEDWTGVTSTTERRKLQNRLNQRARRRRNQKKNSQSKSRSPPATADATTPYPDPAGAATVKVESSLYDDLAASETLNFIPLAQQPQPQPQPHPQPQHHPRVVPSQNRRSDLCTMGHGATREMLDQFAQEAYDDYLRGQPCPSYLTTLVRVNVFHAFVRNAHVLGFNSDWLNYDAVSPFCRLGPGPGPVSVDPALLPEYMRPTALQAAVEHHPWIDFFPHPQMRDNFLRAVAEHGEGFVDEDDMCRDIVDVGAGAGVEDSALIAWGEPWDPRGWEATEPFLRKWGWLLNGCPEMLEGTNYWREQRGLRRLK
ncbi:hypothetical protein Cob_v001358 [Colletotrichum orbiculare MAFF 240422]|uniref:BZIP domain-containing protein n=1 Tax=Colletotrichum orbiculare (strain 104-T / ATCC 96160 / CBS 514.97 / LARS 414 / MAFF 240422) TaxID=1213857 RepID=N4VNN4_COLOR|nr:hypothetical protein Cob_v001358 [Colletotrichum orbiculare MAFF 240422]